MRDLSVWLIGQVGVQLRLILNSSKVGGTYSNNIKNH